MPDWAIPMELNMLMRSGSGDGGAQQAALRVQRIDGELVPELGLGHLRHLLVDGDVVAVQAGGGERPAVGDGGRVGVAVVEGFAQGGLEVDLVGLVARRLDVGDVVLDGGGPGVQAAQRGEQRLCRGIGDCGDHSSDLLKSAATSESTRALLSFRALPTDPWWVAVPRVGAGPEERSVLSLT